MNSDDAKIKKLLEQYVFTIVANYLDQVDEQSQLRLIQFYSQLHDQLYPELPKPAARPAKPLTTPENTHRRERLELSKRLLIIYQNRIESLMGSIAKIDQLIASSEQNVPLTIYTLTLVTHYQTIRQGFVSTLEKVQTFHQRRVAQLPNQSL